jgi:hypothetical protein
LHRRIIRPVLIKTNHQLIIQTQEFTMTASQRPEIKTIANLEAAFAGESMAHIKYRYFRQTGARDGG